MVIFKQAEGGIWEEKEWELRQDQVSHIYGRLYTRCRHSSEVFPDGTVITPWVVVARTESGYNSIGICANCIIEAMNEH